MKKIILIGFFVFIAIVSIDTKIFAQPPVVSPQPTVTPDNPPIPNYETELRQIRQDNQNKINALEARITQFEAGLGPAETVTKKIESLTGKVNTLEEINKVKNQNQIALDEIQYKTGLQVLRVMLGNIDKLDFTASYTQSIDKFQNLTNPINNAAFVSEIQSLKGENLGNNNGNLQVGNPLLANPYVSMAWSVGSLLVSKFNKTDKPAKLNKFLCVIDVATRTDADLKIIRSDLSNLSERLKKFKDDTNPLFERYTATVGKRMSYNDYLTSGDPFGAMSPSIITFFAKYKGADGNIAAPPELATARYQVESVKTQLVEYDGIIKQMDDSLAKYDSILSKQQLPPCESIPNLAQEVSNLKDISINLRPKFKTAYAFDVTPEARRVLYGIN